MNYEDLVDQEVVMRHLPSGEVHNGKVEDYVGVDLIVKMCDTAEVFIDDEEGIIDTRFDPWEFVSVV